MKCYNCRSEITEEASFCPKCGSPQKFTNLVKRALENDQNAVSLLYKMTYHNVYQTIRTVANLDDDTVFDLVQNTYIKAFRSLSQLNEPEAFRGWVKVIGRNLTIDHLRKKKAVVFSQMVSVDSDEVIEFEDDRIENLPEVVVDKKETARLLGEILDRLSEEQRIAVYMHYFEQLSVKEIAEILGVSEGTIKSRLNYGRKKIETGVNELEKKGTKLYGLAPVPFLLALFRSQEAHAAELPNPAVLRTVEETLVSGLSGSAQAGDTTNAVDQKATMAAGKETAKTAAGAIRKSILTKVIIGVAAVSVIVAGAAGIRSMNRADEPVVKQENKAAEPEVPMQNIRLDDFIGGYTNKEYLLDLSYVDGQLFLSSGILPGKEIFVYYYVDVQVKGNTLKAKHEEFRDGYVVNNDGTLTDVATDGVDIFELHDDGTLTVTFAGVNDIRSGRYSRREVEKSAFDDTTEATGLDEFLGQYTDESFFCFELSQNDGFLLLRSSVLPGKEQQVVEYFQEPNALDTVSYSYDSFQIDGNTILGYHTKFDGTMEPDVFAFNEDGTVNACFSGTLESRFATYGPYEGEGSVFEEQNQVQEEMKKTVEKKSSNGITREEVIEQYFNPMEKLKTQYEESTDPDEIVGIAQEYNILALEGRDAYIEATGNTPKIELIPRRQYLLKKAYYNGMGELMQNYSNIELIYTEEGCTVEDVDTEASDTIVLLTNKEKGSSVITDFCIVYDGGDTIFKAKPSEFTDAEVVEIHVFDNTVIFCKSGSISNYIQFQWTDSGLKQESEYYEFDAFVEYPNTEYISEEILWRKYSDPESTLNSMIRRVGLN